MVQNDTRDIARHPADFRPAFRLRPIATRHGGTLESARAAVKQAYRDDRVLRMLIVTDEVPPRFVEWVER